jgi:hypothetical protein
MTTRSAKRRILPVPFPFSVGRRIAHGAAGTKLKKQKEQYISDLVVAPFRCTLPLPPEYFTVYFLP